MNNFFSKNKASILLIGGLIIVGGIFWQIVFPKIQLTQDLENKISALKNEKQSLNEEMNFIDKNQAKIQMMKSDLESLKSLVPDDYEDSDLLAQVESVSQETQIVITTISIANDKDKAITPARNVPKTSSTANKTSKTNSKVTATTTSADTGFKTLNIDLDINGSLKDIEIFINRLLTINRLGTLEFLSFSPSDDLFSAKIKLNFYSNPK